MKYVIHRKSKMVYCVNNGVVIDEIDCQEFDYDDSDMKINPNQYSEISQKTYAEFVSDLHDERNMREIQYNMNELKKSVINISEMWSMLSLDNSDKLSEEYPFDESFDEVCDKIVSWVNYHNPKK
jgi:uncharacterized UPF0160 family protein